MSLPNTGRRARRLAVPLIAGALVLTGCADRAESPPTETETAGEAVFPVTITPVEGDPITLEKRPERIVSLSASNTETLFAIGAGDQVVAVDALSNYPADAPVTDLSGFQPNVEAIADHDPDLVIVSDDLNDVVSSLTALGHPVLILPAAADLDDLYAGVELMGKATGHVEEAADVAERIRDGLDKIVADTPKPETALTYYHELDPMLFSATSKTFMGSIYSMFGLTNIADPAETDTGGYPQLSNEHILQSNPDMIFLADVKCCAQNAETVAARPGWDTLNAVKNGNVVALDDDLASRWGPRVVEMAGSIADAVAKAAEN